MSQVHLPQEKESALMLIEHGEILFESNSRGAGGAPKSAISPGTSTLAMVVGVLRLSMSTLSPVHLVEEKVFTQFSDEEKESKCWVLDSGASNNMIRVQDAFAELDSNIHGTIKFGDGLVVEIEGVGTVLFIYRNGEHCSLTGVYLIPKLMINIVSLGQLDGIGYVIVISDAVMQVRDEQEITGQGVEGAQSPVCSEHGGGAAGQLNGERG
jgi:hypothetical protein